MTPERAGADGPDPVPVAEMGPVHEDQRQGRRAAGHRPGARACSSCTTPGADRGRPPRNRDLARDAGDQRRPGVSIGIVARRAAADRRHATTCRTCPAKGSGTGIPARISACTGRIRSGFDRETIEARSTTTANGGAQRAGEAGHAGYIARRMLMMMPTLMAISAISVHHHPAAAGRLPDDLINEMEQRGEAVDQGQDRVPARGIRPRQAAVEQYFVWMFGMLQGDFGWSFEYELPVADVVGDRVFLTFVVTFATIIFIWIVAFPIGIYSAVPPVQRRRLHPDLHRLHRPGDAELPAGAGAAVLRQCLVRHVDRRADGRSEYIDQP